MAGRLLHLLDVHARAEPAALGREDDGPDGRVGAGLGHGAGELEPALDGQRVDRREVDDHLGDAVIAAQLDSHRGFLSTERLLRQPSPA